MIPDRFAAWLYAKLVRCYPAEFRDEFAADMDQDFRMQLRNRGRLRRLWPRIIVDWLVSMPREQLDVTMRDLRISLRTLARAPLFTLVVVLSLAIGIATNSLVFTFANSLLLQTPLDAPARFVGVLRGDGSAEPSSWLDYVDYRERNHTFSALAAWALSPVFLGSGRESESVMAVAVTDNYFDALQLRPFLGKLFVTGDCPSTCTQDVILSHRKWRLSFGAAPNIIGRQITLSGVPATIIGVAPEGFDGMSPPVVTDIWIHAENRRLANPASFAERNMRWLALTGRLRDGVSANQAITNLNAIDRQLRIQHRYPHAESREFRAAATRGIGVPAIRRRVETIVALLGAVALLILLICCANVANMVLARSTAREQETAMRRALGASSASIVRFSLTESMVLAILGGIAGALASVMLTGLFGFLQPPATDAYTYQFAIHPDARVWVFTFVVTVLSGILFGALPALQTARANCVQGIRSIDLHGRPRLSAPGALVSCQVALSLVLLIAAGLFYRSFASQQKIARDFPVSHGIVAPLNLDLQSYAGNEDKGRRFFQAVKDKVQLLPGVQSASLASYVPLNPLTPTAEIRRGAGSPVRAVLSSIDADYLEAMDCRLLGGRNFSGQDTQYSEHVALADERLVRTLWPDTNPLDVLGETLRIGADRRPVRIVGLVAGDFHTSLTELPKPGVYVPVAQRYSPMLYLLVRTTAPSGELMEKVSSAVTSVDEAVSVRRVRTLETQVAEVVWPIRTGSHVVGAASAIALFLAALGLYGVVACTMARRRREMGIRVALGASPAVVLRAVMRTGLMIALRGVLPGLPLAIVANVLLSRVLYGLPKVDPAIAVSATVIWVVIACVACLPPAWGALRNSATALRDSG